MVMQVHAGAHLKALPVGAFRDNWTPEIAERQLLNGSPENERNNQNNTTFTFTACFPDVTYYIL